MKTIIVTLFALIALNVLIGAAAIESPHGDLKLDCNQCHVTMGWNQLLPVLKFDHTQTTFPLRGRHAAVQCIACHTTLKFAEAATRCVDCHADIHRGQFSNNCTECHTAEAWAMTAQMRERHAATRFPLVGVHAQLDCQACHANGQYVNLAIDCAGCHLEQFEATNSPGHADAAFSTNCTECHNVANTQWKNAKFDHSATFPLTGGHALNSCTECHTAGFGNTSSACYSCHAPDFNATTNPDHEAGNFSQNCATCHNINGWQPASFEHNLSDFPLTGRHVDVACAQCHVGGQYTGTPTDCYQCHRANFENTTNPDHEAGGYPQNCTVCHTTNGWQPASFDHNLTEFPLTGQHVDVSCAQCHVGGQYSNTPQQCVACHEADYRATTNPDHETQQFSQECAACHTTNGWQPATFDHTSSDFPLTGRHVAVNCLDCHIGGNFTNTPTDCWSCHEAEFRNSDNPDHEVLNFPQTCGTCHTTDGWQPASFDHNLSDFPLTGRHVAVNCLDCHIGGSFTNTPTDCWSCHEAEFRNSDNPDHEVLNFPQTCGTCHTTDGWQPASFDHNLSDFPLTGRHVTANCLQCHIDGNYTNTPTDCWSCHQANYQGADHHAEDQYPHDCAMCHGTSGWQSTFNHNNTNFPLTGRHIQTNCADCHTNGQFQGTPTDCWSCHQDDYNDAEDHVSGNYPHNCAECHNTDDWDTGGFNHGNTGFPLTGRHVSTSCTQCHVNGQYNGTPTDCWACHDAQFRETTNPDHETLNFPQTCATCHTTDGWEPASFDHNNTDFPLTGRHITVNCLECHIGGNYNNTPTDCFFCHAQDYHDANDPNHDAGFSTVCAECHNTTNWNQAQFPHDQEWFPIYSGRHQSEWNTCSDCHTNPDNFAVFSCIDCHEHNREDTDDQHDEDDIDDYVYESQACLDCHPTGGGGDHPELRKAPRKGDR
jgi:hypothetical protein